MILESKTDTLVLEDGEVQESTNMEIDADSHIFLMRMLSKFYSDHIGSPIRETASNALDSHKASGTTDPIIVSLKRNKDGNYEFSVEDFGLGLDDQDVENIIKKYGKSTKRLSINQLGAFGLGFKSCLAYSTSFYFIGRKDGIERKWMMYESDDESNKIDLLCESETTERNGVKVIIPVKYSDSRDFLDKIKEQLAYFESVYFDCGIENKDIKIFRNDLFQWSSLSVDNSLHICLGDVYYPLDYDKLGIPRIFCPIGLRFSLTDGIFPVPNREQLKYTAEAKKIILSKITQVAEYFVGKYNENVKETNEPKDVFNYFRSTSRNVTHPKGEGNLDVSSLEKYSSIKFIEPKLKDVKFLTMRRLYEMREYLYKEYSVKYSFYNGRFKLETRNWNKRLDEREVFNTPNKIYLFNELDGRKKSYFRDTLDYTKRFFVTKEFSMKLGRKLKYSGNVEGYYHILQLYNHPRNEWRDRIKEWQSIVNLTISKFNNVDNITVPQEYYNKKKAERTAKMVVKGTNIRKQKVEGEITGKVATGLERYVSNKNCKFVSETFKLPLAHKNGKFHIYGTSENEPIFQSLFQVIDKRKTRLVIFTDRQLKNIKNLNLHNWIHIDTFMEGKHIVFKRLVTSYLIHKLEQEYYYVFIKSNKLELISKTLHEKVQLLNDYKNEYFNDADDSIYLEMLKVADTYNLYDLSIYGVYKEVKFILNRLKFIEPMFSAFDRTGSEGVIDATRDLFKYYKQRIDWKHYNLPINEEETTKIEENETLAEFELV